MNTDHSALNDMISTLNDGRAFYQDAATKVGREDLKRLFERMAQTKTAIVKDMQNTVVFTGAEPSDEGSFAGGMRQAYAGIRARISGDNEATYVAELEQFEDRILESFRAAIEASEDPAVRAIAQKHMPEVARDHGEMRALKQSLRH
jgi:uncharacterized protein (TIGR02284 family)